MKTPSDQYSGKEEAKKRLPIELFRFYDGEGTNQRYVNRDISVVYGGNTFVPSDLERGPIEQSAEMKVSQMTLTTSYLEPTMIQFLASNPPKPIWVECLKTFEDFTEADVTFIGRFSHVSFKGPIAEIVVLDLNSYFAKPACRLRYHYQCNHILFDEGCTLVDADWGDSRTIDTVSADGLEITLVSDGRSDGYYTLGYVEVTISGNSHYRMITSHDASTKKIKIRFKFESTPSGTVTLYPGCDGDIETCEDKFSNLDNFLGFPYVPEDNPTKVVVF